MDKKLAMEPTGRRLAVSMRVGEVTRFYQESGPAMFDKAGLIERFKKRKVSRQEAVEFVGEKECDSLAAAIGTSHGPYKFKGKQSLHFEVIRGIQQLLPGTPIVMHGSSSVPEEEVRRINAAGGKLDPSARGVDEEEYLPAARLGVTKINIDTDGRLVWTRVHREFFRDHPEQFDFRPPGKTFVEEYAKFIAQKNEKLGSAGQLSAIRQSLAKRT